jgi:hypothetical protein
MEEEYPPRMYWRYVRRNRVKAKFYSPYRAIPALLVFSVQFIWNHKAHTPFTEMWIAITIIIVVYFAIFILESLWSFTVLTPPKIYGEQVDLIRELGAKNSVLQNELRVPKVSSLELRRRELISAKLKELSVIEREFLRCIHDQGEIHRFSLLAKFDPALVNKFIPSAVQSGLLLYREHVASVKPELKDALEFVLDDEYGQEL